MTWKLDEYICHEGHEFYVHDGSEPVTCPFCGDRDWDWTNTVEVKLEVK